ncbi:MAG: hypothetical protein KG028_08355 [Actinobacteria bacterium]|nr:hypothetical protein [Actinomycetota bacterium]
MLVWIAAGLVVVVGVGWLGLQPQPDPLPPPTFSAGAVETVPLPDGLPTPVARFYEVLYGDEIPVVDSAVISGRGTMRIAGITFPARWRFSHVSGEAYRHYIELTAFGRPVMSVDEHFLDGSATLDLPFGVSTGPNVDQGANLALWAEAVWMPSVWVTDGRAGWVAVDDDTAALTVPFGEATETFTVRFDPTTGLLASMESMRFKDQDATAKTLWLNEAVGWGEFDGQPVPLRATVIWADESSPWADLLTDEVIYNADLADYVRQDGP